MNHKARAKAKADAITLEEFEQRMRGGGNGGGGGGEEPNFVSRWLRQKGREAVEAKMDLLDKFNRGSASAFIESQPILRRLSEEFDAIVNHEGIEADIAAMKAIWNHRLMSSPSPSA